MEPFFVTIVMLGFFATLIALVAIRYRQTKPAIEAIKILGKLPMTMSDKSELGQKKQKHA